MSRSRIGLFGGTFDPPHLGHLILANEAAYQFGLSRLLWVLTPDPPHKRDQTISPFPHRLEMLNLALAGEPTFELSRLEIERPGPHYTVDTVKIFAALEPEAEIYLLIGGDSLRDLPNWRLPHKLVSDVSKIGVMRRSNDFFDLPALETQIPGLGEKVVFIDTLLQNLSSREIRRRVAAGEPYRYYVLPSVYDYIEKNELYRNK
jgi:nicotinate-nucleotide adenylyltransferase